MKVLILGRSGQLARALLAGTPADIEAVSWGRDMLDLTASDAIVERILEFAPQGIINASAYTAVDRAESDAEEAEKLNVVAVKQLAEAALRLRCPLVHVSTDFVFDGGQSHPYQPQDACSPLGVYGDTKYRGELALQSVYPAAAIVRTAWVYRAGSANFMTTMLRLMSERDELAVVADQIGTPTSADNLANVLWAVLAKGLSGIWHYTDAGAASWYDFAVAIQHEAKAAGVLTRDVPIRPIASEQYPTPARRPCYSVLDSEALRTELSWSAIHWQEALREQIRRLSQAQ